MAQLVKLPSGMILNLEHIANVYWLDREPTPRLRIQWPTLADYEGDTFSVLVGGDDALALWRYLEANSYAAT